MNDTVLFKILLIVGCSTLNLTLNVNLFNKIQQNHGIHASVIYQKHVSGFKQILQENDLKIVVSIGLNVKKKVIKHANIARFRSMFHRLKDNDISKTAVSKSRIPKNELIRAFDKSPTKYKLIGMFQAFFNFFTLHTKKNNLLKFNNVSIILQKLNFRSYFRPHI